MEKQRRKARRVAKFISLFAGVGGFDLGMEKAGHECVAQVEWDKNAAGVLKHRWPNVPLFCDVSKVSADDLPDADFITYGFPCQDLSVAGKREGLDGKRSGLFYEATRIIKQLAERAIRRGGAGGGRFIAIAENVRGLLSSGDGYDFARCIRELHNIGASEVGWSVLDSQYLGVAQRRKRVFLIADFGGESTSEILAFSEGVSGHPAPSREAGKGTARDARAGFTASSFGGYEQGCGTLRSQGGDLGGGSETLAVNAAFSDGSQTSSSLTTRCHNQFMPDKGNFCAAIQAQGADVYNGEQVICRASDQANAETLVDKSPTLSCNKGAVPIAAQSTRSDPDLMATLCAKDNEKVGSNQWVKEGKAIIEGVDVYNGELTGETSATVTTQTGTGSGSGPKVMSFAPSDITRGFGQKPEVELSGTLKKEHNDNSPHVVTSQQGGEGVGTAFHASQDPIHSEEHSPALGSNATIGYQQNLTVRRLTPIECERLQGFPDNWTSEKMELTLEGNEWKATGKVVKQADGPRYRQQGNAVTVNVAEYLGKQIAKTL